MKIRFNYLGHFYAKNRHRVAWAGAEATVRHGDSRAFALVLDDGVRGYRNAPQIDEIPLGQAFFHNDAFWCRVYALNDHGRKVRLRRDEITSAEEKGGIQGLGRDFFWKTFGFTLLSRMPDGNVFQTGCEDARGYRNIINRKGFVSWDDTGLIEERVRRYIETNIMAVDGELYCRIDHPCFDVTTRRSHDGVRFPPRRIFTPYGGHGGPNVDYGKGYLSAEDYRHKFSWSTDRENAELVVFEIPDVECMDPSERNMRAVFSDMFRWNGWAASCSRFTPAKTRKLMEKAFGIWAEGGYEFTDDALDDVAELLIGIPEDGPVLDAIEGWLNRSVEIDIARVAGQNG
jgi:hypothetical protein